MLRLALLCPVLALGCAQGAPDARDDAGRGSADAAVTARDGAVETDGDVPPAGDGGACADTPETCNGADDDCDGNIDEDATDGTMYFRDLDGDGWGSDTDTVVACARPDNAVERGGDCQDGSSFVNPDVPDGCDGVDNDCAGGVDDMGCPAGCVGVPFGGAGYAFCSTPQTWVVARDTCAAAGLRLVRVDTDAENAFLFATASADGGIGEHFLGGRVMDDGTNRWRWADGVEFWEGVLGGSAVDGRYFAWESDQPDDNAAPRCTVARAREEGRWHDTSCDAPLPFVCELY